MLLTLHSRPFPFSFPHRQIVKHFKELGCVVNKLPASVTKAEPGGAGKATTPGKEPQYLATLLAPLVFPAIRKKRM